MRHRVPVSNKTYQELLDLSRGKRADVDEGLLNFSRAVDLKVRKDPTPEIVIEIVDSFGAPTGSAININRS